MPADSLLGALGGFFDEKKKKQKKKIKDLETIIAKLEKYQVKLETELRETNKKKKVMQLQGEIKIVRKKCKKAHKLLQSLQVEKLSDGG